MADEIRLTNAVLRPWRLDDAEPIAKYANNRNIWRNLRDRFPHPYSLQDAHDFLAGRVEIGSSLGVQRAPTIETSFAIEVDGEAAGSIGLLLNDDIHRGTAELGYWLAEPHWGRGIATEAARAMVAYGFEHLELRRIEAVVFAWNPASARVLEKTGLTLEARLRKQVIKDGGHGRAALRDHLARLASDSRGHTKKPPVGAASSV